MFPLSHSLVEVTSNERACHSTSIVIQIPIDKTFSTDHDFNFEFEMEKFY